MKYKLNPREKGSELVEYFNTYKPYKIADMAKFRFKKQTPLVNMVLRIMSRNVTKV